jgi:hypothetical protein
LSTTRPRPTRLRRESMGVQACGAPLYLMYEYRALPKPPTRIFPIRPLLPAFSGTAQRHRKERHFGVCDRSSSVPLPRTTVSSKNELNPGLPAGDCWIFVGVVAPLDHPTKKPHATLPCQHTLQHLAASTLLQTRGIQVDRIWGRALHTLLPSPAQYNVAG